MNDQTRVKEFVSKYQLKTSIEARFLDLVSEIGEASKEILKGSNFGKDNLKLKDSWVYEIGDIYFSLLCLCNLTEIDIEKSLTKVLEKYKKRIDTSPGFEPGSRN
ncbi:nucleotide pyrophosphohydrolase [Candidatus Atribacteria bacterium HGW-Atribacteria-1]|nr:MAG: nucleotide pyrophosphohydrolase [Candidatus Atribacteria bacterium HGW-Atribacteria-1]